MGLTIASRLISLAASAGFVAVALGAFGAHALEESLNQQQVGWWETATFYLLAHAICGLSIGLTNPGNKHVHAGWIMVIGALIFSGMLYAMALGGPRWFGAIVPIGGVGMLMGWALLCVAGLRSR